MAIHRSHKIRTHIPCPHCSSSDGYCTYADGHGYCHSCNAYDHSINELNEQGGTSYKLAEKLSPDLIIGEIKALTGRKITTATCEHFDYSVGKYQGKTVQIAPYYNKKGKVVAQHLRDANKEMPWVGVVKAILLFGQNRCTPGGKMLIVTEGEIDALSIWQALHGKWDVVSVPNGAGGAVGAIKKHLDFVDSYYEVCLAFDNDEPGKKATEEVAQLISPGKCRIFKYPSDNFSDANDMLKEGQAGRIFDSVFNSPTYRPDGIIDGCDLRDDAFSEPDKGYMVPYPALNKMFQGFRKGELYLFTAGSGVGKSTVVTELGYHFLTYHSQKLGVIALEDSRRKTVKKYVGLELNLPLLLSNEGCTKDQINEAFDKTVGSGRFYTYDHWGSVALDNLISKFRYLALGFGVDWIILDHISIVVSGLDEIGESERRMIDKLMTRIRSLIEETGIGVMAIVHLNRPNGNSDKSYNEGKAVSLRALRGSGALEQLSDGVIALERDQQAEDPNVSLIRVLKNRTIGTTGICDTLRYDHKTGRLLPDEGEGSFTGVMTEPISEQEKVVEEAF